MTEQQKAHSWQKKTLPWPLRPPPLHFAWHFNCYNDIVRPRRPMMDGNLRYDHSRREAELRKILEERRQELITDLQEGVRPVRGRARSLCAVGRVGIPQAAGT